MAWISALDISWPLSFDEEDIGSFRQASALIRHSIVLSLTFRHGLLSHGGLACNKIGLFSL